MRKIAKMLAAALAAIVILAGALLGYCAYSYSRDMRIDETRGINEAGYVEIGGIDQWIQIRGRDRNNAVLLWLTGGPGLSQIPRTYFYRSWEEHFTLVLWDQRGEGKTFERSGTSVADTMTIERIAQDGIEVVEYLRDRLGKDKIVLLGFSWGSMVGVHMAHERPDLLFAYVGTGQVVNLQMDIAAAYPLLIERARKLGNEPVEQQLAVVGPPPYPDPAAAMTVAILANVLDPTPARTALPRPGEIWAGVKAGLFARSYLAGARFSVDRLWAPMLKDDLSALGSKFEVPVVFIQGTEDLVTLTALAKDYFDEIEAPSKEYVALPGIGHLAVIHEPDRFLGELTKHVRPLALAAEGRVD